MKTLLIKALGELITYALGFLTVDKIREFADLVLDKVEDWVADSETDLDDKTILPLIDKVRVALNIPDND